MSARLRIEDPQARQYALRLLQQGGVVVLPTDTLYGLSAAASSKAGVARIRAIKRTRAERLFIVLASSVDMVERHVRSFGCTTRAELGAVWPAPMTAILPVGTARAQWMGDTVAVRVPNLPPLLELIESLGEPIVSTSVNRGGEPPRTSLASIEADFGRDVDLLVTGDEDQTSALASTIVDFAGDEPVVLREGDFAWPPAGDSNPSNL
jgi:tRNA threonylcarbamoyl adenosine modification protein (Sua5/YciO/YrdC/YwlC family)